MVAIFITAEALAAIAASLPDGRRPIGFREAVA
jgi:hypothetical protein